MRVESVTLSKPLQLDNSMENYADKMKYEIDVDLEQRIVFVMSKRTKRCMVIPFEFGVAWPMPAQTAKAEAKPTQRRTA